MSSEDGRYIGISASIQAMAERLFRAIGREDMLADPRFRTNTDRVQNAEACEAPIVEFIGARTLAENMEIFGRAEVTAAPVYDIDQFMSDPHVIAREILVDLPDTQMGQLPMHNVIPRLSATPGRLRRSAPALGEHTAEVLGALGLDRAAIDGLARDGVMASPVTCRDRRATGLALTAVRPRHREALCRRCGKARRRRDHPRPRRQCGGLGEGKSAHNGAGGG